MSEVRTSRSDAATRSVLAAVVIMSLIAVAFSGYLWAASIRLRASGAVARCRFAPRPT